MTVAEALRESGLKSIDAELLAALACNRDRTWIVAHSDDAFDPECYALFQQLCLQRKRGEPIAYMIGQKEFFGRMFCVTPATLIPRPATESLVHITLDALDGKKINEVQYIDTEIVAWSHITSNMSDVQLIVDIGTGSGCIGVTLACERPDLHIIATDISELALDVARENATKHGVGDRITFKKGDGLSAALPINESFIIVSNPPYIPLSTKLDGDVIDFEPALALFAGEKGTDILDPLIAQAMQHPFCKGFIIECREEQTKPLPPNAILSEE